MLDEEKINSPTKKLKASGNYISTNEAGGVAHHNYTVANMIGSTTCSIDEASYSVGIEKEDEKGLKDENMLCLIFL